MLARGEVKWYNMEKGYGFILPEDNAGDVFFHSSALNTGEPLLLFAGAGAP
jgi:CspA family cold shock protein